MIVRINAKCDDRCEVLVADLGAEIHRDHGYVPEFVPGFPDYVQLEIEVETGRILNWKATRDEILRYVETEEC